MCVKTNDFAIVGGGVAGCLLVFELLRKGYSVVLFDDHCSVGSSAVAAGIINPITGRKFVKSWKIDKLLDHAIHMYSSFEKEFNLKLLHKHNLVRGLKTIGMQNDWSARVNDQSYRKYINEDVLINSIGGIANNYIDYAVIENAYRIDFNQLMLTVHSCKNNGIEVVKEYFNYANLLHTSSGIRYNNYEFREIIFAEGSAVRKNDLWNDLPFVPAHGERFIIRSSGLNLVNPFIDGKIIIPLGSDRYWVGSNYNWDVKEPVITEDGYKSLKTYLDDTLTVPYQILDHSGHIRPSTYNRRPFVGRHDEFSNCYILNGLGAKGASLAPYCVDQLLGYILDGESLDEEIDVERVNR